MTSRLKLSIQMLGLIAGWERCRCEPATSEEMARRIGTNPVVVRRLMVQLRRAGLVETKRGAGGGVRLGRPPEQITLRDVYEAVEEGEACFTAETRPPRACCPLGGRVGAYLREVYAAAEEALKERLAAVTIRDVYEAPGRVPEANG